MYLAGNLITDAWIHSNTMFTTDIKWARASVALLNGGAIRASIVKGQLLHISSFPDMF